VKSSARLGVLLLIGFHTAHAAAPANKPEAAAPKQPAVLLLEQGTEKAPLFVQEVKQAPTHEELEERKAAKNREERYEQREDRRARNDENLVLFTGLLAIATAALFVATVYLVRLGQVQAADAKVVAEAAKISAEAAKRSSEVAEASLTQLERPWFFHVSHHFGPIDQAPLLVQFHTEQQEAGQSWTISVTFENVGRVPGLIEKCEIRFLDIDTAPDSPAYTSMIEVDVDPKKVAANKTTRTPRIQQHLKKRHVVKQGDASARVVAYGRLTYMELNGRVHHTGFSVLVNIFEEDGKLIASAQELDGRKHYRSGDVAGGTFEPKGYEYYD